MKIISINSEKQTTSIPTRKSFDFELPDHLQCAKPTEERGIRRDEVRLMVSHILTDKVAHTVFNNIDQFLRPGDVLVVNTSGTLKAALEAFQADGKLVRIHFSTKLAENEWIVEVREIIGGHSKRYTGSKEGDVLAFKNGGSIELIEPYYHTKSRKHLKLWQANIHLPIPLEEYLDFYGKPIKYQHVKDSYPQAYYQTAFAQEMGSAEMPSAGRPFTPELITRLVSKGIQIAPILLHTGVASLELDERPYDEYFRVPPITAELVNMARKMRRRVIAVGTTAIRALESAADRNGIVHAKEGWTDVFITPQRGLYAVDALLTGFHEPKASHLLMLEALAGRRHLAISYTEALDQQYHWHEFGDLHLILP